jgi:hypothetical protein
MPEHSVRLAADPARRGERTVAAPQANLQAGAFDKALGLLVMAEAGPLDELQGARVDLLRGQIAFSSGLGDDAPPLLLNSLAPLVLIFRSRFPHMSDLHPMKVTLYRKEPLERDFHWFMPLRTADSGTWIPDSWPAVPWDSPRCHCPAWSGIRPGRNGAGSAAVWPGLRHPSATRPPRTRRRLGRGGR